MAESANKMWRWIGHLSLLTPNAIVWNSSHFGSISNTEYLKTQIIWFHTFVLLFWSLLYREHTFIQPLTSRALSATPLRHDRASRNGRAKLAGYGTAPFRACLKIGWQQDPENTASSGGSGRIAHQLVKSKNGLIIWSRGVMSGSHGGPTSDCLIGSGICFVDC